MQEQLQLYDNYGLWHVPFWQKMSFILFIFFVSILLIGYLIFTYYRFMKKRKQLSPQEKALQNLIKLKEDPERYSEKADLFYVELTGILKEYMGYVFQADIKSCTDRQMIAYLEEKQLFDAQKEQFRQLFSAGESVKFACKQALGERMQDDLQCAITFVQKTTKEH